MNRRALLRAGVGALGLGVGVPRIARRAVAQETPVEPLGRVAIDGTTEAVVGADGRTAYVAATDGYATIDISDPADPTVLADRRELLADREGGPIDDIYDVKVDGDRLLVVGPATVREGISAAVLVDVADPSDPVELAASETDFHIHNCYLDGDTAYLTGNDLERNALVMLDVADDEFAPIAEWSILEVQPEWESVSPWLWYLHDVWVGDDVAYLAYWDAGTWLLDVADPADPQPIGSIQQYDAGELTGLTESEVRNEQFSLPGNDHYAAANEDGSLLAVGREAWTVEDDEWPTREPGGIDLYGLDDPSGPELLASIDAPESPEPTYGGVWTTAHNFELRDGRLYSSWYQGGVRVHDIADPSDPIEIGTWSDREESSFWTAQAATPGETFVASSMGLRDGQPALWTFSDPPIDDAAGEDGSGTTDGTPGFGLGAGALGIGVGAAAWRASRRWNRETETAGPERTREP
ncbi:LVIVD repeat-containing protein [Haloferacaceae archaeon DSL9]